MVVDTHVNIGGLDTVVLQVASYFSSERSLAFSKRAVGGKRHTDSTKIYIEPQGDQQAYSGKVTMVVSGSTVGSAEVLAMATRELRNVKVLGRSTPGQFSDILDRDLPNGWSFGLSNEFYASPDGTLYEVVGVPPDFLPKKDLLPLEEREDDIDSWLEAALELPFEEATCRDCVLSVGIFYSNSE